MSGAVQWSTVGLAHTQLPDLVPSTDGVVRHVQLHTRRCKRCAMSDLAAIILLIGAGVTAVAFPVLFAKRYPKQRGWLALGIVIGLAAMFLWPLTLWAALAMWLTGFARAPGSEGPEPAGTDPPAPAGIVANPAGRAGADAHLGGLLAQRGQAKLPKKIVISLCSLGALATLVVIGLTAEPVPPSETDPVAAPTTPAPPTSSSTASPPTVVDVVDGDTVKLNNGRTVRIIGIDSPATVVPGKPVDCWGPEAADYARQTLLNKSVTVVADPTQDRVDGFGRHAVVHSAARRSRLLGAGR